MRVRVRAVPRLRALSALNVSTLLYNDAVAAREAFTASSAPATRSISSWRSAFMRATSAL